MSISKIVAKYNRDPHRLMDILLEIQQSEGCVSEDAVSKIATQTGLSSTDVQQTVSFYHFFTTKPAGKHTIYLNNSAVANLWGRDAVAEALIREVGCPFGSVSKGGFIGLFETADIGMNDQEPAALIDGIPFTRLTPESVKTIVDGLHKGKKAADLITAYGDGLNGSREIQSMVSNNIRAKGEVYFGEYVFGNAVRKCASGRPEDILEIIKASNLRGRGGAGFPTGMKWEFCRKAQGKETFLICNADEGEPGTFKDRVMLTELAPMVFEGMVAAGYVIRATQGIMYLRAEYRYLLSHLEKTLADMRERSLLGTTITGKDGFNFDIRIQCGAGAYVCGEETALIESAEGKRGEPRNRPPFPAQRGFMGMPTVVNNVETLAAAARIIDKGAAWFSAMGTDQSAGTKLLSVSGDCEKPGIYEVTWGLTIEELLALSGATEVQAVQVGGPSGVCVGAADFDRVIGFEDTATGGSVIIIGKNRSVLKIVHNFMEFFCDESCGSCVPCRAGSWILRNKMKRILEGKGTQSDIKLMLDLGNTMKTVNKCGLGQTAANPVVTSIVGARAAWDKALRPDSDINQSFDLAAAVADSCKFVNRNPSISEECHE